MAAEDGPVGEEERTGCAETFSRQRPDAAGQYQLPKNSQQQRRENIERLLGPLSPASELYCGPIRYTCRLGDTLRTVAARHPALRDISLWKLLAEVNGLSTEIDGRGKPVAELNRGTILILPTPRQISRFRQRKHQTILPPPSGKTHQTAINAAAQKSRKSPPRPDPEPAPSPSSIPASASSSGSDLGNTAHSKGSAAAEDVSASASFAPSGSAAQPMPACSPTSAGCADELPSSLAGAKTEEMQQAGKLITQLSECCRLIRYGDTDTDGIGFRSRLEVLREHNWCAVLRYEINSRESWRHEFSLNGGRKSTRIDLPPSSAKEMAEREMMSNWKKYCADFLRGRPFNE